MVLGLLPSIRGGLGELATTGQQRRLINGYFKPYARVFEEVRYFSYLDEKLEGYTSDPAVLARVRLYPGRRIHPWFYAFYMPILYRREFQECAVLRAFQVTGVIPALIAKRVFGVPFVTTYGFWYTSLARSRVTAGLSRVVARVGLAEADAVIVTTDDLRAFVIGKVGTAKVYLIPNGVDTSLFRPVPHTLTPVKNVLYVGRLSAEKNLESLIDAVAKLRGRFDVRVTLVGQGPLRERLEVSAMQRAVPVQFVPLVEHHRLPDVFVAADAFVLPSFTEGHPKVLLEAMSCGVACIASDVSGNRAVLTDGETGLLFDPHDPGALAERLAHVLACPDVALGLGARARSLVVERYDLSALVASETELLHQIGAMRLPR
jgi:glycosyltransferase involved in cell wall biosynthesis